jgi:hypothetical protein
MKQVFAESKQALVCPPRTIACSAWKVESKEWPRSVVSKRVGAMCGCAEALFFFAHHWLLDGQIHLQAFVEHAFTNHYSTRVRKQKQLRCSSSSR